MYTNVECIKIIVIIITTESCFGECYPLPRDAWPLLHLAHVVVRPSVTGTHWSDQLLAELGTDAPGFLVLAQMAFRVEIAFHLLTDVACHVTKHWHRMCFNYSSLKNKNSLFEQFPEWMTFNSLLVLHLSNSTEHLLSYVLPSLAHTGE